MATKKCLDDCSIYDISFKNISLDELYNLYAEILLPEDISHNVESALTQYVTKIIEPVGWTAIWKIPKHYNIQGEVQYPSNCHFIVEVHDVSLKKLQALVKVIRSLHHGDCQEHQESTDDQFQMGPLEVHVPLIQLFPLRDQEGMFLETAKAIHTVRFFYEHLWRPWDDEDDENFIEKHLRTRLNLYFERVSGCLPEVVDCRIHEILTEASEIDSRLEQLQSKMTLSDSEEELDEEDVRTCVKLRMCMETLQREMEILENPLLRNLVSKKDFSEKQSQRDELTIHLVSKRLTLGMMKSLPLEENDVLEVHRTLEGAVVSAVSGDTILIFPGHYRVGQISWLEKNLTIKGLGEENKVILEASDGCGDLFLSCNSHFIMLSNLEIIPSSGMMTTIMVHGGNLKIENCILKGAKNALVVLDAAEAHLNDCQILNSQGDAIQIRARAKCSLTSCCIYNSLGSAVKIGNHDKQSTGSTYLTLIDCKLLNNKDFALLAEHPSAMDNSQGDVPLEKLQSIPFLELSLRSVHMSGNGKADFGLCSHVQTEFQKDSTTVLLEECVEFKSSDFIKPKCLSFTDSL